MPKINEEELSKAPHYNHGQYDVFTVAEDWGLDKDAYLFSALRYIARCNHKKDAPPVVHLIKARNYLNRRIDQLLKDGVPDTKIQKDKLSGV